MYPYSVNEIYFYKNFTVIWNLRTFFSFQIEQIFVREVISFYSLFFCLLGQFV